MSCSVCVARRVLLRNCTIILTIALLLVTPFTLPAQTVSDDADEARKTATVIFTADLEENLRRSLEGRFGVAEVSAVVDYARQDRDVIVLDAGGTGTAAARTFFSEYPDTFLQILETIGYDALTPGPGELQRGPRPLFDLRETVPLHVLGANLAAGPAPPLTEGHTILTAGELRIGVFGLTMPGTDGADDEGDSSAGFDIEDPVSAAERSVSALEASAVDVVIALTHLGLGDLYERGYFSTADIERAQRRLSGRVDLVIDGGNSRWYEEPFELGRTVVAAAGGAGSIGAAEIVVAAGDVDDIGTRLINAGDVAEAGLEPMPEVSSMIGELSAQIASTEPEPEPTPTPHEERAGAGEPREEAQPEDDSREEQKPDAPADPAPAPDSEGDDEDGRFAMPELELFFEAGPTFYNGATGYGLSLGATTALENIFDFDSAAGRIALALLLRYDGLRVAAEELRINSIGPAVSVGYRFDMDSCCSDVAVLDGVRVIPRLTIGGMSLSVSKDDRSAYDGFSAYLAPGVLIDKMLPLELRAGMAAEYNMTFGDTVWRSLHIGAFVSWTL